MSTDIEGIDWRIKNETLVISSISPLKTLGSSVLGGGFSETRYILNHHVEKDFSHQRPDLYLEEIAAQLGITERVVAMMTAADLKNFSKSPMESGGIGVTAIVTGGVSNAARAGEKNLKSSGVGTINTVVIVHGHLIRSAMVGAVITCTEAKTAAIWELGVEDIHKGLPATGTTTDAVVIACTGEGPRIKYSGTGTQVGELIGRAVKKATMNAIKKQENLG